MDGMNEWIYPTTRIGDAVRFRPASLEVFYRLACDPWKESGKTLRELGEEHGMPMDRLARELASLPVPGPDTPWEDLPTYYLIDYLTAEHRQWLHSDLPALRTLLEMPFPEASGGHLFRILLDSFHRFQGMLSAHLQEEEDRIFPAILRNEYALLSESPSEDDKTAAERLLASSRLIVREDELSDELGKWTLSLATEGALGDRPKAADLAAEAMRRLERKIRAHSELERQRLYPIAVRVENALAAATRA